MRCSQDQGKVNALKRSLRSTLIPLSPLNSAASCSNRGSGSSVAQTLHPTRAPSKVPALSVCESCALTGLPKHCAESIDTLAGMKGVGCFADDLGLALKLFFASLFYFSSSLLLVPFALPPFASRSLLFQGRGCKVQSYYERCETIIQALDDSVRP